MSLDRSTFSEYLNFVPTDYITVACDRLRLRRHRWYYLLLLIPEGTQPGDSQRGFERAYQYTQIGLLHPLAVLTTS